MWNRGRLILLLFITLFIVYPVQGVIVHEDFDSADEDLYSIMGFLADTKVLCEEALDYTLESNCSISFDQTIELTYSDENLGLSVEKSEDLLYKLQYSSELLNDLKDKAGSYQYLKDFLYPIKDLGGNVSSFVDTHYLIIKDFIMLVDFVNQGGNSSEIFFVLSNASSRINSCRNNLVNIERRLDEINQTFSTVLIQSMIPDLRQLLDRYDDYLDLLVNYLPFAEPTLLLYVEKDQVYLDEEIQTFGYFIAEKSFVENQTIRLFWEDTLINTTLTDTRGRYEFIISSNLDLDPGFYNISTSTTYNGSVYSSNIVLILVKKIPTNISLHVPKTDYYLNETIIFSGRLVDYKNNGISSEILLDFAGFNVSLLSDINGSFSYDFDNNLSFGKYSGFASFNPSVVYEESVSETIFFNVNTPTVLTVFLTGNNSLYVGDEIQIYGWLNSKVDGSALSNKSIVVFLNNQQIGSTLTNDQGFYNFSYDTDDLNPVGYVLFTRFISDDIVWRSSSSQSIELKLSSDFIQELLQNPFFAYFISIIIISIVVIFFLRKKLKYVFRKGSSFDPTKIVLSPSQRNKIDGIDFTLKSSKNTDVNLRDSIIYRYHSLLRFLSTIGVQLNRGVTHLDIQKKMLKQGFSEEATNSVTKTFEYAMYSPYPIDENDYKLFDENIRIILTVSGGF